MPAPEDRFLGAPRTEPRSEHRRRRATERYLEIDFRHPELGAFDCDCKIEPECERPSATDRGSVDSANRYLIEMRQHVERAADQARQLFAELVHPPAPLARITCLVLEQRSVGACAKCGALPGHDEDSASAIIAHRLQMALEFENYFLVQTVAALRPAECDRRNRTVFLDDKI